MNFRTILLLTPALSFLYFSLPNDVCAQSSSRLLSHNNRAYELCLVARNKGRKFIYRRGKPVRIEIKEDGKRRLVIKGLITRFEKDAMIIGSFKKNAITGFDTIKPGEIEKIRMLSRPQRKFSAMALAGAVAYSGTMLLLIEETGPRQRSEECPRSHRHLPIAGHSRGRRRFVSEKALSGKSL